MKIFALSRLALGLALLCSCGGGPQPKSPKPAAEPPIAAERAVSAAEPVPLAAEDVLFGLQSALPKLRACLTAPGAVRMQWQVNKRGDAEQFHMVWSTLDDAEVADCLAQLMAERSFQLPSGQTHGVASWTFVRDLQPSAQFEARGKRKKKGRTRRSQGVQFDPPGRLDASEVDGIVQSGMRLYAHCLRAAVETESSVSGKLALSWTVDEAGRPNEVSDAGSDINSQMAIDCAAECFYALEFPPPTGGAVKVTYALLFNED